MTRELQHDQLDVAVLLTEGMVADIVRGSKAAIVQTYVSSPLTWGVFANAQAPFTKLEDYPTKRFAVSRIGSGSHLMAQVFAAEYNYQLHESNPFTVVGNLDGAVEALVKDQELLFLWEEFTTKHLVEQGVFKMINKFETPWPCFVIAARKEVLDKRPEEIVKMLSIINTECKAFMDDREGSLQLVMDRHQLNKEDAMTWFDRTTWQCNSQIDAMVMNKVISHLYNLKIIKQKPPAIALCSDLTEMV